MDPGQFRMDVEVLMYYNGGLMHERYKNISCVLI